MRAGEKLKTLSLFAGIGGFDLGLERTGGFETVAFCEIDPYCRRVLAKHWPNVRQYEDVRELTADTLRRDGIAVDVICGGFPCQDISLAGKGAGIADGTRSGLWAEYARLIGELRPQFVLVENVAALLGRGLDRVLGDLAEIGYDAEWHCIPAAAVGAPHRRDRLWIVAYPNRAERGQDAAPRRGMAGEISLSQWQEGAGRSGACRPHVSDPDAIDAQGFVAERYDPLIRREQIERQARLCRGAGEHQDWTAEPALGRVAHGVPDRVGQLRAYGNAVVPQIPELIGNAILSSRESARSAA